MNRSTACAILLLALGAVACSGEGLDSSEDVATREAGVEEDFEEMALADLNETCLIKSDSLPELAIGVGSREACHAEFDRLAQEYCASGGTYARAEVAFFDNAKCKGMIKKACSMHKLNMNPEYWNIQTREVTCEAPRPEGEDGGSVEFFEHVDFTGASFSAAGEVSFVGWDWNDRITSIRIPAGRTVILYEHGSFGGASIVLDGDQPNLIDLGWNDFASSLEIH